MDRELLRPAEVHLNNYRLGSRRDVTASINSVHLGFVNKSLISNRRRLERAIDHWHELYLTSITREEENSLTLL